MIEPNKLAILKRKWPKSSLAQKERERENSLKIYKSMSNYILNRWTVKIYWI